MPELPAAIEYPLEVMDEIRAFACDELLQLSHGGREVGGVMFGVRRESGIRILTWRPLLCEYTDGESLHLSARDRLGLAVQLERARVDPNLKDLRPVGWFVSHPRSEVSLARDDRETYESFFPESWQVTLVMHPAGGGVARAGFFQREPDGSLKTDSSYREFSFEPLHLAPAPAALSGAELTPVEALSAALAKVEERGPAEPEPVPAPSAPSFQIAEPIPSKERWLWAVPIGLALALIALLLYYRQSPAANPAPSLRGASQASSGQIVRDPDPKPVPAAPVNAPEAQAPPAASVELLQLRGERDQLAAQVQQKDQELRKERARGDQLQNLVRILENRLNITGDAAPNAGAHDADTSHLK